MEKDRLVIAIDGPAGAGKSTIAKEIAKRLDLEYIDTGAMYRALTLKVINNKIDINDIDKIIEVANSTSIKFKNNSIYLDGIIVDGDIRKNIVNTHVSNIAKIKEAREIMVSMQREMSRCSNIIMDGRDIGTVVFPNANYKFFLIASIEERARRRYLEILQKGEDNISYEKVLKDIKTRDTIDSTRDISPLKKALDAYEIDTTDKSIEETVMEIINIVEGR